MERGGRDGERSERESQREINRGARVRERARHT